MSDHGIGHASVDKEREHSFDGITEFDNRLPNWWLWTFYIACIFSVFYWLGFHVFGVFDLPRAAFDKELSEMAATEEAASVIEDVTDDALRELAKDPEAVAKGKKVFAANCIACHMASGGGSVGPNLTDKFWIHGGAPTAIYKTVTEGVLEKGMLAWESIIGTARSQQVTAYVLTLRNTDVDGGKPPEGEPYEGK